eukprot:359833-Chlamydomonas_euryale.AAC.8
MRSKHAAPSPVPPQVAPARFLTHPMNPHHRIPLDATDHGAARVCGGRVLMDVVWLEVVEPSTSAVAECAVSTR